jgi:glycosyltransferase involved in cell wall biosynthesis
MKIAVILPAFNEEITIEQTIKEFHEALPEAEIYVIDNCSTDRTKELAQLLLMTYGKGKVIFEQKKGKGNAIKTAFKKIEADIYVLADADATYPAHQAKDLIHVLLENDADMVVGNRQVTGHYKKENKRTFHVFGNQLVNFLVNKLFNTHLTDIMSGYRVFNRKFVKNYPIIVEGFEIETDMTLHALHHHFKIKEVDIVYRDRPKNSFSKLNTLTDGKRVLLTLLHIFRFYKPLKFFGILTLFFAASSLIAGYFPIHEFFQTHYITKVPLAILACGFGILSMIFLSIGLILDTLRKQEDMQYHLHLLKEE